MSGPKINMVKMEKDFYPFLSPLKKKFQSWPISSDIIIMVAVFHNQYKSLPLWPGQDERKAGNEWPFFRP